MGCSAGSVVHEHAGDGGCRSVGWGKAFRDAVPTRRAPLRHDYYRQYHCTIGTGTGKVLDVRYEETATDPELVKNAGC